MSQAQPSPENQAPVVPSPERRPSSVFEGVDVQQYKRGRMILIKRGGKWVEAVLTHNFTPKAGVLTAEVEIYGTHRTEQISISEYAPPVHMFHVGESIGTDKVTRYRVVENGNRAEIVYTVAGTGIEREIGSETLLFLEKIDKVILSNRDAIGKIPVKDQSLLPIIEGLFHAEEELRKIEIKTTITEEDKRAGETYIAASTQGIKELETKAKDLEDAPAIVTPTYLNTEAPKYLLKTPQELIAAKKEEIANIDKKTGSAVKRAETVIHKEKEAIDHHWKAIQQVFLDWYVHASDNVTQYKNEIDTAVRDAENDIGRYIEQHKPDDFRRLSPAQKEKCEQRLRKEKTEQIIASWYDSELAIVKTDDSRLLALVGWYNAISYDTTQLKNSKKLVELVDTQVKKAAYSERANTEKVKAGTDGKGGKYYSFIREEDKQQSLKNILKEIFTTYTNVDIQPQLLEALADAGFDAEVGAIKKSETKIDTKRAYIAELQDDSKALKNSDADLLKLNKELKALEAHVDTPDHDVYKQQRKDISPGERVFDFSIEARTLERDMQALSETYAEDADSIKRMTKKCDSLGDVTEQADLKGKMKEYIEAIGHIRSILFKQEAGQVSFYEAFVLQDEAALKNWLKKMQEGDIHIGPMVDWATLSGDEDGKFEEQYKKLVADFDTARFACTVELENFIIQIEYELQSLEKQIDEAVEAEAYDKELREQIQHHNDTIDEIEASGRKEFVQERAGEKQAEIIDFSPKQMEAVFAYLNNNGVATLDTLRKKLYTGIDAEADTLCQTLFDGLEPAPYELEEMGISNWDQFVHLWRERLSSDTLHIMGDVMAKQFAAELSAEVAKKGMKEKIVGFGSRFRWRIAANIGLGVVAGGVVVATGMGAIATTLILGSTFSVRATTPWKKLMDFWFKQGEDERGKEEADAVKHATAGSLLSLHDDNTFAAVFRSSVREVSTAKAKDAVLAPYSDKIADWNARERAVLRSVIVELSPAGLSPEQQEKRADEIVKLISVLEVLMRNGQDILAHLGKQADPEAVQRMKQVKEILNGDSKAGWIGAGALGASVGALLDMGKYIDSVGISFAARGILAGTTGALYGWSKGEKSFWEEQKEKHVTRLERNLADLEYYTKHPLDITNSEDLELLRTAYRNVRRLQLGKATKGESTVLVYFDQQNNWHENTALQERIAEALATVERMHLLEEEPKEVQALASVLEAMQKRADGLEDTDAEKKARIWQSANLLWKKVSRSIGYAVLFGGSAGGIGAAMDWLRADAHHTGTGAKAEASLGTKSGVEAAPVKVAESIPVNHQEVQVDDAYSRSAGSGAATQSPPPESAPVPPAASQAFEIRGGKLLTATGDFIKSLSEEQRTGFIDGIKAEHPDWVSSIESRGHALGFKGSAFDKYMDDRLIHKYQLAEIGKDDFGVQVRATAAGGTENDWTSTKGFDAQAKVQFVPNENGYYEMKLVDTNTAHDLAHANVQHTGGEGRVAVPDGGSPEVGNDGLTSDDIKKINEIADFSTPEPTPQGAYSAYTGRISGTNPDEYIITPADGSAPFTVPIDSVKLGPNVDGALALEAFRAEMANRAAQAAVEGAGAAGGTTPEVEPTPPPAAAAPEAAGGEQGTAGGAEAFGTKDIGALKATLLDTGLTGRDRLAAITAAIEANGGKPVTTGAGTFRIDALRGLVFEHGNTSIPVIGTVSQLDALASVEKLTAGGSANASELEKAYGVLEGRVGGEGAPVEADSAVVDRYATMFSEPTGRPGAFSEAWRHGDASKAFFEGKDIPDNLQQEIKAAVTQFDKDYVAATLGHDKAAIVTDFDRKIIWWVQQVRGLQASR